MPRLSCTIWLKPFDLGVSQRLIIDMPYDEQTRLYKASATIERLSGTRDSWMHLNRGFVRLLRRHFLHWRALTEEERERLFEEASSRLAESTESNLSTDAVRDS